MPDCNAQQRPHAMPGLGNAEGTKKQINERMGRDLINLPPPTAWENTQDATALGGASREQNILLWALREGQDEASRAILLGKRQIPWAQSRSREVIIKVTIFPQSGSRVSPFVHSFIHLPTAHSAPMKCQTLAVVDIPFCEAYILAGSIRKKTNTKKPLNKIITNYGKS